MIKETDKKEKELLSLISDLESKIKKLKDHKRYGLVWENKIEKFDKDSKDALPILREKGEKYPDIITDKNKDFNILIEGDNYHSLSILSYTHKNKIDVIYIDPPYNTGNKDFIYNDYYVDREDRFRHSKWLSFMSKRMKLAKNLLKKEGVIFISIDDNEVAQLTLLCNEIFGEDNFVVNMVWENKEGGGGSDSKHFKIKHEYILVYAKSINDLVIKGEQVENDDDYKGQDEFFKKRGKYKLIKLSSMSLGYIKSLDYPIEAPDKTLIYPNKDKAIKVARWRWSKKKFDWGLKNGFVEFKQDKNDEWNVYTKQYFKVDNEDKDIIRTLPARAIISEFSSTMATKQLDEIFGKKVFDYSKPYLLIKKIIKFQQNSDALILDFMAGSGTTGQAVLELNKDDGGNRKFILCTNNGDEKSEHRIATDVCYPRVQKVIQGYKSKGGEKINGLGGNLKYLKTDFVKLEKSIDYLKHKIVDGSTEILCLKEGSFKLVVDSYKKNRIKVFQSQNRYTAILFDLFYFEDFVEQLKKLKDKPVSVYVFSYAKDFSKEEFGDLDIKFTIEAIPEKILETYKTIFNF